MKIFEKIFPPYFGWSHGAALFLGYLLASIVAKSMFSFGVGFLEGLLNMNFSELVTAVNFAHTLEILRAILGHVAGGVVIVLLVRLFSKMLSVDLWREIGWTACRQSFIIGGILGGLGFSLGVLLIRYSLFDDRTSSIFNADGMNLLFWCIPSLLFAPVIEETLFRGALYWGILQSWGKSWAFGCVTFLDSIAHLLYFPGGDFPPLFVFFVYFMSGLVTLVLRMKSDSLIPSIAFHIFYNLIWILHLFSRLSPNIG